MIKFYDVFIIGGIFCSFIISIILFFKASQTGFANRLLGISLFAIGWYALMHLLVVTTWIKEVPYLYRVGSPLYYLVPPFCYFYVRSMLYQETRFRKWDWLHVVPAVLSVIDLLPFYFSSAQTKIDLANSVAQNIEMAYLAKAGFLPAVWHFELRPIQGLTYLLGQWFLVLQAFKYKEHFKGLQKQPGLRSWLIILTTFGTLLYTGLAEMSAATYIKLGTNIDLLGANRVPLIFMSLAFFGFSIYLFFRPELLYGYYQATIAETKPAPRKQTLAEQAKPITDPISKPLPKLVAPAMPESKLAATVPLADSEVALAPDKVVILNKEQVLTLAKQLEHFLKKTEVYRRQGISISELSVEVNIPARQLSFLLNNHYNQRFNDFINGQRIDYIINRLQGNGWKELTLEGLAAEAGFASRSTFFAAFKKFTNLSPSEYLKNLQTA